MTIRKHFISLFALSFALAGATAAQAQTTLTIQPTNRGWLCDAVNTPCAVYGMPGMVQATGLVGPLTNIFAGSGRVPNMAGQTFDAGTYRNWFQFAIPKLSGPLVSATLTLPERNRWNGQDLQYQIYGLNSQPKVFTDISGQVYGTVTTTDGDFGGIVHLVFNAYGLAAIEGSQGKDLFFGGIDSGETAGGYHGDFSGTNPALDFPPFPLVDPHTPLALVVGDPTSSVSVDQTCTGTPAGLNSFVIEHVIDLSKILSSLTANVPASFAPVFAGTMEARNHIDYDSTTKIMTNEVILVPVGAPYPTAPTVNLVNTRLVYLITAVDTVRMSCVPRPSVMLTGMALDGVPLFGNPAGSPVSYAFGYTMDSPAKVRDLVNLVTGVATVYETSSPYAQLIFNTVGAVISGGPVINTTSRILTLDGSLSGGGPLTYSWTSTGYGMSLVSPNAAKTTAIIDNGPGAYSVTLKVRNNAIGQESTAMVTINYKPGT